MNITIKKVITPTEMQNCFAIRFKVFVEGQQVPIREELDGKDESADHYLLCVDNSPAGTARVRYQENIAKIERVAILDTYQGKGLGKKIMEKILFDLHANPQLELAKLSAQTYAIIFYEKLGFSICSDEYLDAGILHKDMQLSLRGKNGK